MSDADPRAFRLVVSYRRVDTGGDARSLAEALAERFGEDNVFFDIHGIAPGQPFDQVIAKAVAASDVFIACIGQHWLTVTAQDGSRRIDNPKDYVRRELEGALAADVLVIPVTFEGAQMPSADDLPDSLKPFSTRNDVDIRAARWHDDVRDFSDYLAQLKRKKLRAGRKGVAGLVAALVDWAWNSGRQRRGAVLTAAAVVLAAVLGGFGIWALLDDPGSAASPRPATTGTTETRGTTSGGTTTTSGPESTLAYSAGSRIFFLAKDSVPTPMNGDPLRSDPDWSLPHGTRLAYGQGGDIWTSNPDGSDTKQVTNGPADDGGPAWSPDGKWIAFNRGKEIWIVDSEGNDEPRRFTNGAAPDWSPDGKRLVFQRVNESPYAIWISDFPNATNEVKLSEGYPASLFPAWSPDGRRIAFILPTSNGEKPSGCTIVVMKPNRRDPRTLDLKRPLNDQCRDVAWSADGRSLTYAGGDAGIFTVPRYPETAPKPTQIADVPGAKSPSWSRP